MARFVGRLAAWPFFAFLFLIGIEAKALDVPPEPMHLLIECEKSFASIEDYTAVFVKHQRIRGRLRKPETIFLKFKKPYAIYMKWIKMPDEGKEVIYVEGKNDGKLIGHPGGILNLFTPPLHLSPDSPLAMSGNLKPITQAGVGNAIDSILRVSRQAEAAGDLQMSYKGKRKFEGRQVHAIERILPDGKGYPNCRAVIFIDDEVKLPIYYAAYDAKNQLVEEYIYRDLKLNVGLTEKDFSTSNPEYGYGLF